MITKCLFYGHKFESPDPKTYSYKFENYSVVLLDTLKKRNPTWYHDEIEIDNELRLFYIKTFCFNCSKTICNPTNVFRLLSYNEIKSEDGWTEMNFGDNIIVPKENISIIRSLEDYMNLNMSGKIEIKRSRKTYWKKYTLVSGERVLCDEMSGTMKLLQRNF